ncbi:phytoene/squalene synthase family protein [Flavobacterium sp. DGU11]|uniref:Phytoene/squalene synthase family protein n=1 Tax=Flavobacterium arundinis TaxID=3139143 RepID=A0ABU9HXX4_9FLAO
MKSLYDDLSQQVSRITTKKYSTSFSLGIMALRPSIRPAIYAIYGYVRLADEIVDSFHEFNKRELLERFRRQTFEALDERISINPILNSFQEAVRRYGIGRDLIIQFLKSMEMDLDPLSYDSRLYDEYILGSAEVVGLMCLHVFTEGDKDSYHKLKPYAMKLGSAFQKVNFLRDLNHDYSQLGRTYFPGLDLAAFDHQYKNSIEREIASEFEEALVGIRLLPPSSRFGVYLACRYYFSLLRKIRRIPAEKLLDGRVRINNAGKITVMVRSYVRFKFASI